MHEDTPPHLALCRVRRQSREIPPSHAPCDSGILLRRRPRGATIARCVAGRVARCRPKRREVIHVGAGHYLRKGGLTLHGKGPCGVWCRGGLLRRGSKWREDARDALALQGRAQGSDNRRRREGYHRFRGDMRRVSPVGTGPTRSACYDSGFPMRTEKGEWPRMFLETLPIIDTSPLFP